jgi:energy-coupling factor transporter transmembrane protein EcfT
MRGGFRHQRGRALQLLLVTVVSNALRRAEETALAAEARAFDPQRASHLTISHGRYDWLPWLGGLVIFILASMAA